MATRTCIYCYLGGCVRPDDCANSEVNMNLEQTLQDRGSEYGNFTTQATMAQEMKESIRANPGFSRLVPHQAEALDMILHKIARIVNGNPNNVDSWLDIEGYARIVRERIKP